jgi:hypothetical protein
MKQSDKQKQIVKNTLKKLKYFTAKTNCKMYLKTIKYLCKVLKKRIDLYYHYKKQEFIFKLSDDVQLLHEHCRDCRDSDVMLSDMGKILKSHSVHVFDFLITNKDLILNNINDYKNNKYFYDFIEFYQRNLYR